MKNPNPKEESQGGEVGILGIHPKKKKNPKNLE
jgi:hypothetical protein